MVSEKFALLIHKFVIQDNGYKKELEKMEQDGEISESEKFLIAFHVSAKKVLDKLDVINKNLTSNC